MRLWSRDLILLGSGGWKFIQGSAYFFEKLASGYLPTMSILRDRGVLFLTAYPYYELKEETIDHDLFCCLRVVWIWRMADLLSGVSLMDNPTQIFLQSLKASLDSEMARTQGMRRAYMAYHIWLSRNNWVLESRRLFAWFILEWVLIQAIGMIHLEFADLTIKTSDSWDTHLAHGVIYRIFIC